MSEKNWIEGAIRHPGAFHKYAAKNDGLDKEGNIKDEFISSCLKSKSAKVRKMAQLAQTLSKMHRGGAK